MAAQELVRRLKAAEVNLPPLYKFLDVRGAKLTLGNRTFKHSKPSDFNDTEDLTVQSLFAIPLDLASRTVEYAIPDVVLRHLDFTPTCAPALARQVVQLQEIFRANPGAADILKRELPKLPAENFFEAGADAFLREINTHLQDYRVLCVSSLLNSPRMWTKSSFYYKGIALRIEGNVEKDSKFQLLKPVTYREKRPPFHVEPLEYIAGSLFGHQQSRMQSILERIIYSKTLSWKTRE